MDYEGIKRIAKKHKLKVQDLLALSPSNDPFYVGQPRQLDWAKWFTNLWYSFGLSSGVHLRRIHYQLVSQDPPLITPDNMVYENTDNCWDKLGNASKWARYLGIIPLEAFVDRRNPDPLIQAFFVEDKSPSIGVGTYWEDQIEKYSINPSPNLGSLPDELPSLPEFCLEGYREIQQPFLIEIWAEKTTMNDVLEPLCQRYGVNLVTGAGELSITAVSKEFISRVAEAKRPARILYISDFDPAGIGMPISVARKIEFELYRQNLGFDIKLQPIVLTASQIKKYRLPRVPVKDSDSRKGNFQAAYGVGQVELDALEALHPGELASIVRKEILRYYDPSLVGKSTAIEAKLLKHLEKLKDELYLDFEGEDELIEENYQHLLTEFSNLQRDIEKAFESFRPRINRCNEKLVSIIERKKELHDDLARTMQNIDKEARLEKFPLPQADLPEESDGLLYDSTRQYYEQIQAYRKQRKGKKA